MRSFQPVVHPAFTLCVLRPSDGDLPGRRLCENHSGLSGEAAAIDGSSFSYTLWHIIFPICKPILVTVAIIQVFSCWNEFSFALVLIKDVGLQTVPLALTQFKGQFASDYPKQMAAMLITMSPIVILYFVFSKQIIKGMVAGAVKG